MTCLRYEWYRRQITYSFYDTQALVMHGLIVFVDAAKGGPENLRMLPCHGVELCSPT